MIALSFCLRTLTVFSIVANAAHAQSTIFNGGSGLSIARSLANCITCHGVLGAGSRPVFRG
ncbi:MAG: hypothetical protein JWM30_8 [Burkholderia sp.]|jgi:mono/diheme cytochrome c family protein|nr:hypothetical protein [Burkholderia sp.]